MSAVRPFTAGDGSVPTGSAPLLKLFKKAQFAAPRAVLKAVAIVV
jgi:hypothetical protein